jgi:hypothetical protein
MSVATVDIASFARGRGGNPWIWGALSGVGCFLAPFFLTLLATLLGGNLNNSREHAQIGFFFLSIAWIAELAFGARFLAGRLFESPGGMGFRPSCRCLNQPFTVMCEASSQP